MTVNDSYQTVDYTVSSTVTNGALNQSIFAPIAALLSTVPQITSPVTVSGGIQWRQRVKIHAMEVSVNYVGSQGTAITSGDLYNFVRTVIWETRDSYSVATAVPLLAVHSPLNLVDTSKVHYDVTKTLSSQAFNAADYNAPQTSHDKCLIPVNKLYDWFTVTASGTSGWDTKAGNIFMSAKSDSFATPHPQLEMYVRIYFRLLKAGSNSTA